MSSLLNMTDVWGTAQHLSHLGSMIIFTYQISFAVAFFSTMPLCDWSRDRESVNDIEPGEMCLKTTSV